MSRIALLAAAFALLPAAAGAEPPRVVATIAPLHSLVAGVMAGIGEPALLMPVGANPHSFSLRPSEAAALQEADVIFQIGPALETFLAEPLETLAAGATIVTMMDQPGMVLLPTRIGGSWPPHHHDGEEHEDGDHAESDHDGDHHHDDGDHQQAGHDAHEDGHDHDHEDGLVDGHVWLDPANARAMVAAIETALSAADPEDAAAYAANAAALTQQLVALEQELRDELARSVGRPFVVFHDAYHYFEARFGLNAVGAITVTPELAPGAARLRALQDTVRALGATCVFGEPDFQPRLVETVAEGLDVRRGILDDLGTGLEPGPELYPQLLRNLAATLADCLS